MPETAIGMAKIDILLQSYCMDYRSSQVDLLPKGEIFDCIAVTCDAAGITLLQVVGGMGCYLVKL